MDDGSPDNCPRICDEYAEKDSRIVVIHKENGGLSDARNAGIDWAKEHSSSDWLAFVDSDDYLHEDYLKTLYETAQKEDADLVICDFIRVDDNENVVEKKHKFFDIVTDDKKELFEVLNASWRIDMAWNKLYAKPIFDSLRFAFGKIHEDEFAIHHVLWNCRRAAIIYSSLYYYRTRENSIMASKSPKSRLDSIEALIEQYEFCLNHDLKPRDLVVSDYFLSEVASLKEKLDKRDGKRYKKLKKRFKSIYFGLYSNRKLRRRLRFFFYQPCCRIADAYRKAFSKDIRRN